MASKTGSLLTVANLDAFPEDDGNRYELIGGELFVSRAPGIPHQRVLHNLQMEFGLYLKAHPIGILVPGAGAIFSDHDAVIPDLVFVRNERWDQVVSGEKFTGAIDLVIETLARGGEPAARLGCKTRALCKVWRRRILDHRFRKSICLDLSFTGIHARGGR